MLNQEKFSSPVPDIKKQIDDGLNDKAMADEDEAEIKEMKDESDIRELQQAFATREQIEEKRTRGNFPDLPVTDDMEEISKSTLGEKHQGVNNSGNTGLVRAISADQKEIAEKWVKNGLDGAGYVWVDVGIPDEYGFLLLERLRLSVV